MLLFQMTSKKQKTRHSSSSCFGPATTLPDVGSLYTSRDVLAAVEMAKRENPDKTDRWCIEQVTDSVKKKWIDINPELILIQDNSIMIKLERYYANALEVNANKMKAKKKKGFLEKMDKVFDILHCQCENNWCSDTDCNPAHCQNGAHINCSCLKQFKIPPMELSYIKDQRDKVGLMGGDMLMIGIDAKEAMRKNKQLKRQPKKDEASASTSTEQTCPSSPIENVPMDKMETIDTESSNDADYSANRKGDSMQNTTDLSLFTAEVCRYRVSDRAAAALYNAALKTVGLITDDDKNLVVDKSNIRRSRDIFASKQKKMRSEGLKKKGGIQCLGTDGKRDKKTKVCEIEIVNGVENKKFSTKTREHIVYTEEPGGEYLCHSELSCGTGKDLSNDAVDVLAVKDSIDTILAILCDGTFTNTGWKDGMIAHTERVLMVVLLWLICQLHGNELPLRHYFDQCDGCFGTSGPDSFKGPIGQASRGNLTKWRLWILLTLRLLFQI